ncbi:glycosyl transferase [Leptolyngbya sp. Heron Island J]|uniref:glycosyltransferase n=1 Tax=Leptolyngbya sp. Heron Island J TaxID=1385935 RepID=UPI0003B9BAFB|nr:glycosyltransferase [Leptolyngbya sp. Heron Island J]ESA38880.1 glycosyl transferase [Leptolyngbya sp. Heron Island J]
MNNVMFTCVPMKSANVLFLTTVIPSQKRGGGEVASQAFIDGLRQNGCQVSVVGYMRKDDYFDPSPHELLVEKRYIETRKAPLYAVFWIVLSFLLRLPYSAAKYYSNTYIKLVKFLLKEQQYDVIFIDHSQLAWLSKLVNNRTKVIFIAHNIEREIYLSHLKKSNNFLGKWLYAREAKLVGRMESELSKEVTEVWTLTEHDANYFSQLEGNTNLVKALALPPNSDRTVDKVIEKKFDIGLIGSWTWKFNEEGLRWFFKFVYPELSSQVSIHVAGKGAEWLREKYPNVRYEGFVPSAQAFMAEAKVIALPMRGGSGIQIKTLDALASGSAIIATPPSMRGISLISPIVKIAEQPQDFARLLSVEVSDWNTQKNKIAQEITSDWLKTRRKRFQNDIASSIEDKFQAMPQMLKS